MTELLRLPLDGEVIAPGESLSVLAFMHPFRADPVMVTVPLGSSIAEIVAACECECGIHKLTKRADVVLGDETLDPAHWHRVRPKAGTHIAVHAVPGDFIITPIIGAIASALSLSPFITGLLTAAAGFLVNLALSALFPPASTKSQQAKTLYSIAGTKNEVSKWDPIPAVLGKVRMGAKYIGSPFTTNKDDDQYITIPLVWGFGPLDIRDMKIGETPIDDYEEVTAQTFYGYRDGDGVPDHYQQTLYTRERVQEDMSVVVQPEDGWVSRTTADDAIRIEVDVLFANGIYEQKDDGFDDQFVKYEYRYRLDGSSGAWSSLTVQELRGDSTDPIRRTHGADVVTGRYEVQSRNLSDRYSDDDKPKHSVNFTWSALRTVRKSKLIDFDIPLAITVLRMKATDELNGTPDDVNALVTSKGRHWTGSSWIDDARIDNPADLFRLVLQGPANKRPVADAKIDLSRVQAWHNRCDAKGFTFNMVRDFRASVWDTLRDVCAAGRAVPLFRDGIWSVAYETSTAPIVQHFTPRNSWGLRRRQEYRKLPDALRCKFLNADKGWIEDEILVFPVGSTKNKNTPNLQTEQVEFPGVTDRTVIVKLARYRLAELALRPATYTLTADIDHLVCTRGDRVYVASDVLMNTLAFGRVKSVSGQTVTLDTPVTMAAGQTYGFRFRKADGTSILRTVVTVAGTSDTITLSGSGTVPADGGNKSAGDLWSFGPLGQEAGVYRVREIRHNDDMTAEIELVDDAPGIEDADDQPIPDYDSGIVLPIDPTQFPPKRLRVVESLEIINGVGTYVTTLLWEMDTLSKLTGFFAKAVSSANQSVTASTTGAKSVRFLNLKPGIWTFRVLSRYSGRRRNRWSDTITVAIKGNSVLPASLPYLRTAIAGQILTLGWGTLPAAVQDVELRYSPRTSGAIWETMGRLDYFGGKSTQLRTRDGTYAIKPRNYAGGSAKAATFATVSGTALLGVNLVQTISEPGTFAGEKSLVVIESGALRLTRGGSLFARPSWFTPAAYFDDAGQKNYAARGTYKLVDTVDLGAVYTSTVTAAIDARGAVIDDKLFERKSWFSRKNFFSFDASDWNASMEMRTTDADPSLGQWSDWMPVNGGDRTFRAVQFRLLLESFSPGVTPLVASASATVDMPERIIKGSDIVVPPAGLTVTFNPPFKLYTGLVVTGQDMGNNERLNYTKTVGGFTAVFKTSTGGAVSGNRTIDYQAIGAGMQKQ